MIIKVETFVEVECILTLGVFAQDQSNDLGLEVRIQFQFWKSLRHSFIILNCLDSITGLKTKTVFKPS